MIREGGKNQNTANQNTTDFKELLRLLRPYQWIKNMVVFLPIIFNGSFFDFNCWEISFIAFICFCMISSSIYCLNDVKDCKSDRLDPEKCNRPVACGNVKITEAIIISICLAITGILICMSALPLSSTIIVATYLFLNILYCFWLKHLVLLDVTILAIGFVLRVIMGGSATGIWISPWIVIMTFLLALFLALSKRRHELVLVIRSEKRRGRNSISGYTLPFLNSALSMLGAVIVVGYIMYTLQPNYGNCPEHEYLYITALPVLFGILRYLQLTIVENGSGDPSRVIYKDIPLIIIGILWFLSFIVISFVKLY